MKKNLVVNAQRDEGKFCNSSVVGNWLMLGSRAGSRNVATDSAIDRIWLVCCF